MDTTDSYLAGFMKAAEDAEVNPYGLLYLHQMEKSSSGVSDAWNAAKNAYNSINGNGFVEKLTNGLNAAGEAARASQKLQRFTSGFNNITDKLSGFWYKLGPDNQRALLTSLIVGSIPLIFSSGNFGTRLLRSLGAGALGGLGMYGLSKSDMYDRGKNFLTRAFSPKRQGINIPSTNTVVPATESNAGNIPPGALLG